MLYFCNIILIINKMKKQILILIMFLVCAYSYAQMDDKFYHPDKELIPIDSLNYNDLFYYTDNDTIHSIIIKPTDVVKSTIIYFHGNGGNISKWTKMIRPLVKENYQVCMIDYRGYGQSSGLPTHLNIAQDARTFVDSLLRREDVKNTKIIIYGASIGTQVATLITKEYNNQISGLILDGTISSFTDVALATSPEEYHEEIRKHVISPYSAIENSKYIKDIKVLFIHSKTDFIPISQAKEVYDNISCPKKIWIYEGKHIEAPLDYPDVFVKYVNWLIE